jgi:hypothetical protein
MNNAEEVMPVYKAFDTATGHDVLVKNTQDSAIIAFNDINTALLNAGDPHGLHYGIRHYEGKTYATEVTKSDDSMDARGFKVLEKPMYVYSYPPNWSNDMQKDGAVKIGRQTRGTCILTLNNAYEYLTKNSENLVFLPFGEAQALPENQRLYLETRPSANLPQYESCCIC